MLEAKSLAMVAKNLVLPRFVQYSFEIDSRESIQEDVERAITDQFGSLGQRENII